LDKGTRLDGSQYNSKGTLKSSLYPSRVSKVLVVVEHRIKNRASRFTYGLGAKKVSFSTIRA